MLIRGKRPATSRPSARSSPKPAAPAQATGTEAAIVERARADDALLLSLVAEEDGERRSSPPRQRIEHRRVGADRAARRPPRP